MVLAAPSASVARERASDDERERRVDPLGCECEREEEKEARATEREARNAASDIVLCEGEERAPCEPDRPDDRERLTGPPRAFGLHRNPDAEEPVPGDGRKDAADDPRAARRRGIAKPPVERSDRKKRGETEEREEPKGSICRQPGERLDVLNELRARNVGKAVGACRVGPVGEERRAGEFAEKHRCDDEKDARDERRHRELHGRGASGLAAGGIRTRWRPHRRQ